MRVGVLFSATMVGCSFFQLDERFFRSMLVFRRLLVVWCGSLVVLASYFYHCSEKIRRLWVRLSS